MNKSLLTLLVSVVACSSGPSGPLVPPEPEGTVLIVDDTRLILRDAVTGNGRIVSGGPMSIRAQVFDENRVVRERWVGDGVKPGLEILDLATGQASNLLDVELPGAEVFAVAAKPDRSSITFVIRGAVLDYDASTLHSLDLATSQVSLLWPEAIRQIVHLQWMPDGRRLLAQVYDGLDANIVMFDFRGAEPCLDTIAAAHSRLAEGFSISPDGRRLAFTRWVSLDGPATERHVLHLLDFADPDKVTNLELIGIAPHFDPRGNWLVYARSGELRTVRLVDGEDRGFPGNPVGLPVGWM